MKKISILMLLLFSTVFIYAQSLDDINDMMDKKNYAGAKTAIDKYLAEGNNNTKADGWYFKGRIYNSLSYEKTISESDLYDLKNAAFEAFKKYQQLDPKDVRMKLENYGSYLDLYFSLYDLGANLFNNKNYAGAYNAFKKALEIEEFIIGKKYTFTQVTLNNLDTALVLNTAIAATQAKKEDEAIPYYKKLVDANVVGQGYQEVYEYLVEYFDKKAAAAAFNEMLVKGRKNYPSDNYWNEIELSSLSKKGDQAALFAKYDEILSKEPGNFIIAYNYSVELYKKVNDKDVKQPDDNVLKDKLTTVLKIAIASDTAIDATVLMANHFYNMASDYLNAISLLKGTKPEDVKKKNELKALSTKKMDECITYADLAVKYFEPKTKLKPIQSANYKIVLSYLSEIYNLKGDKKKADEYDKRLAALK